MAKLDEARVDAIYEKLMGNKAVRGAASKTPFDSPATTAGPAPAVDLDTAKL